MARTKHVKVSNVIFNSIRANVESARIDAEQAANLTCLASLYRVLADLDEAEGNTTSEWTHRALALRTTAMQAELNGDTERRDYCLRLARALTDGPGPD